MIPLACGNGHMSTNRRSSRKLTLSYSSSLSSVPIQLGVRGGGGDRGSVGSEEEELEGAIEWWWKIAQRRASWLPRCVRRSDECT